MAWYNRNAVPPAPPSPPSGRVATNAPRHWPTVVMPVWVDNPGLNLILIAGPLMDGLKGAQLSFMQDHVFADGILRVPLQLTHDGQSYAIFAYAKADAAAAAHYSGVRALLKQRAQVTAVYYAPAALTPAAPAPVLEPIDTPHFSAPSKERGEAEYALWWPSTESPQFAGSETLAQLDRWFEALEGYAAVPFSSFVKILGLVKEEPGKPALFALPSQRLLAPVDGPAGTALYLHASEAEGLWLAFDVRTDPARRDLLLKLLGNLAAGLRSAAQAKGLAGIEKDRQPLAWWRTVRAQAIERGADDPTVRIGRIAEEGRVRTCFTGVTTAAEREARVPRVSASPALMALVHQAFDAAVALASKPDALEDKLPAPGEEAPPNIHPMLLTHKDGHVQQASLYATEAPAALQLAPSIVNGRGGASMAVLIWDGVVRDGEQRTDALIARAQERPQAQSLLFVQTYTPRRRGQPFALLGNLEMHGVQEPILPPTEIPLPPFPAVRPELEAYARESLGVLVSLLTTGDPSATKIYRRGEPIWSPLMQILKDGKSVHVSFAMFGGPGALAAAPRMLAKEPGATMAAFLYDVDLVLDRQPAREIRIVAHEPGMAAGAVFAQSYLEPDPSRPFTLLGDLRPLCAGPLLFVPA